MPRTSLIVVAYNNRQDLGPCLAAVDRAGLDPADVRLILVDNASTDGTADYVREELLVAGNGVDHTRGGLPVVFLRNESNRGFAGGNNVGLARAAADGDEFVYLLNPDTEAEPGFLAAAIAAARTDPRIAFVQSLILRHGPGDLVNTYGNELHFLGFGYAAGDGQALADPAVQQRVQATSDIGFASGAGMLGRVSALREIGFFQDELFLYEEDLELSWRALLAGWRVVLAPASRIRHKYTFGKSLAKFYFLERNRWLVLGWCYRAPTLALLAPALVTMELGLWAMAVKAGWWREKARATAYLLTPTRWPSFWATRQQVQALRKKPDREITAAFTGRIVFEAMSPWPLTHVANPLFAAYWSLARRLLRW
jgi:N-acetylglucosaminyl-diphospho-decaprenol L-rhamnosyltransferase